MFDTRARTRQPGQPVGVSARWRSRGFKWAVTGSEPIEVVSGLRLTPLNGASRRATTVGAGLETNTFQSSWSTPIRSTPATEATLVWHGDFIGPSSNNVSLAGFPHDHADGPPYANVYLGRSRDVNSDIALYFADALENIYILTTPLIYQIAQGMRIVATVKSGDQRIYVNGVLAAQGTQVYGSLWNGQPVKYLDIGNPGTNRNPVATTAMFAASDIAVSDAEARTLSANPWQIFRAPTLRIAAMTLTPAAPGPRGYPVWGAGPWGAGPDFTFLRAPATTGTYSASAAQAIALAATATSTGAFAAAIAQAVALNATATTTGAFSAAIAQSVDVSDTANASLVRPSATTQSITVNGTAVSASVVAAATSQAVDVSDAATAFSTIQAAISQAVDVSDTATASATAARSTTQAVVTTATATTQATLPAAAAQAVDVSDSANASLVRPSSVAQAVDVGDSATTQTVVASAAAATVDVSDSATSAAVFAGATSETVDLSDSATSDTAADRSTSQAVNVSDSATSTGTHAHATTQAVDVSDAATSQQTIAAAASQAVDVADSATAAQTAAAAITQVVDLGDSASSAIPGGNVYDVSADETMALGDSASAAGSTYNVTASDGVDLSDTASSALPVDSDLEARVAALEAQVALLMQQRNLIIGGPDYDDFEQRQMLRERDHDDRRAKETERARIERQNELIMQMVRAVVHHEEPPHEQELLLLPEGSRNPG